MSMRRHAGKSIGIARLSLFAVLLACLAIRPVLLVAEPLHELAHVVPDAQDHPDSAHARRATASSGCAPLHAPGMHNLMQRHGVIVAAGVPAPAPIRAMLASAARFVCADIPVPVARYTVPFRPPIACLA